MLLEHKLYLVLYSQWTKHLFASCYYTLRLLSRGRHHCCQVTHMIQRRFQCMHSFSATQTFSVTNTFLARPHRQACTQARMHAGSLRLSPLKASTCLVLTSFMVISCTVSATKVGCVHKSRLAHMNPHLQHPCQASVHCHCLPPSAQSEEDVPQSLNWYNIM